jgi:hypothetical protein
VVKEYNGRQNNTLSRIRRLRESLDFVIEFIGPLYNLLQRCTNHYLQLDILRLLTTLLQLNCQLLLVSRYVGSGRTTKKTSIASQRMSSVVAYSLPRDMFAESLPSSESVRHNMKPLLYTVKIRNSRKMGILNY